MHSLYRTQSKQSRGQPPMSLDAWQHTPTCFPNDTHILSFICVHTEQAELRAPPMNLDAYLAQHTSEDNASFARLQVWILDQRACATCCSVCPCVFMLCVGILLCLPSCFANTWNLKSGLSCVCVCVFAGKAAGEKAAEDGSPFR